MGQGRFWLQKLIDFWNIWNSIPWLSFFLYQTQILFFIWISVFFPRSNNGSVCNYKVSVLTKRQENQERFYEITGFFHAKCIALSCFLKIVVCVPTDSPPSKRGCGRNVILAAGVLPAASCLGSALRLHTKESWCVWWGNGEGAWSARGGNVLGSSSTSSKILHAGNNWLNRGHRLQMPWPFLYLLLPGSIADSPTSGNLAPRWENTGKSGEKAKYEDSILQI